MSRINKKLILECLQELSDRDTQLRLWLSDGKNNRDVSSFIEACEGLFGDSYLNEVLAKGYTGFGIEAENVLLQLHDLIHKIDGYTDPQELIDSENLVRVRALASMALRLIAKEEMG
jgi:hypothetical protein